MATKTYQQQFNTTETSQLPNFGQSLESDIRGISPPADYQPFDQISTHSAFSQNVEEQVSMEMDWQDYPQCISEQSGHEQFQTHAYDHKPLYEQSSLHSGGTQIYQTMKKPMYDQSSEPLSIRQAIAHNVNKKVRRHRFVRRRNIRPTPDFRQTLSQPHVRPQLPLSDFGPTIPQANFGQKLPPSDIGSTIPMPIYDQRFPVSELGQGFPQTDFRQSSFQEPSDLRQRFPLPDCRQSFSQADLGQAFAQLHIAQQDADEKLPGLDSTLPRIPDPDFGYTLPHIDSRSSAQPSSGHQPNFGQFFDQPVNKKNPENFPYRQASLQTVTLPCPLPMQPFRRETPQETVCRYFTPEADYGESPGTFISLIPHTPTGQQSQELFRAQSPRPLLG